MLGLVLPVILMVSLLLIGVPVAFAMAIAGTVGLLFYLDPGQTLGILQTVAYGNVVSYLLSTIPMFLLMAEFLRQSKISDDVFESLYYWIGHYPGGLAYASTLGSGGMAALSGSTTATAAAMSRIAVPEMLRFNYDSRLAMGAVCAGGTFATMIPPSIALIVYGVITENSIAALFIAGVVPGLLTIGAYGITIFAWTYINPDIIGGETPPRASLSDRVNSVKPIWPAVIIVVLVIGGLYVGAVTPTEAGAVGALGTLLVGVGLGRIGFSKMRDSVLSAAEITVMIFMIIIGAVIFGRYLSVSGAARRLLLWVEALPFEPIWILLIVLLIYIALGTMMSGLAILILTLPITYPLATGLGYDSIWFGIMLVKTIEIGLVTPPFGLNVFVASSTVDIDVDVGFRGSARFIIADVAIIFLLILFPQIALWLPGRM